VLRKELKLF